MLPLRPMAWSLPAVLLACGGEPSGGFAATIVPPITSAPAGGTESSTAPEGGTTSPADTSTSAADTLSGPGSTSEASAGTTATIYDVGDGGDLGPSEPPGCKGKIDFLFVMERSGNNDLQERLLAAFPAFIDTIEDKFSEFDVHIMVTDSDHLWGLPFCDNEGCSNANYNGCKGEGLDKTDIPDYPCGVYDGLDKCDLTLGAGIVFNAGNYAANVPCDIDGGRRYMTQEQHDLEATFSCMAQVGTSGYDATGEALVAAVSPALNADGGCNAGFIRDDALLMVTLINTGGDSDSSGHPQEWAEAVFAAKGGDKQSVVMLAIHGTAKTSTRITQLLHYFPLSMRGFLTEPSYGPIFADAVTLVDQACQGFTPPG